MQDLTHSIGSQLAKIGQGLKESMDAFKKGEEARLDADPAAKAAQQAATAKSALGADGQASAQNP